jgi:DNA-binding GntR family transcriptional regulator
MKNLGAEHENLDYKAYQIIKDMITERALLPGDKIRQEKLARELGISRTPVVNALKYLDHEKLIKAEPRRGYFVRRFSPQEMVSIFELREVLEGLAARRAAEAITDTQIKKLTNFFKDYKKLKKIEDVKSYAREDRRFHNFVVEVGSKEFLMSMLQTYNIIAFSYQLEDSEGLVRPPDETIDEHLAIISAISRRDSAEAEKIMRLHMSRSWKKLKKDQAKA